MARPRSKSAAVASGGGRAFGGSRWPRGREQPGRSITHDIVRVPSATLRAWKEPSCHTRTVFHVSILPLRASPRMRCPLVLRVSRISSVPYCRCPSRASAIACVCTIHLHPTTRFGHDAMLQVGHCFLLRRLVFPIERWEPCIDRAASREDPPRSSAGRGGDGDHLAKAWSDAHVDMLVRVANSANGGSRRALPWAKVKEWPKKPKNPVLGVDPDVSGALAVLEGREEGWSLHIYDVPTVSERVGTRMRRRHCPAGIACALKNLELPPGCVAYVEMARPLPQNGRQGWYGSGFGYGVWMGALAANGVETVAVHPNTWKKDMLLTKANQSDAVEEGSSTTDKGSPLEPLNRLALKDRSREIAAYVFPQIMDEVKRKKDHGRAEALLLAAWGCGMRCESHGIEKEVLSLLDQV